MSKLTTQKTSNAIKITTTKKGRKKERKKSIYLQDMERNSIPKKQKKQKAGSNHGKEIRNKREPPEPTAPLLLQGRAPGKPVPRPTNHFEEENLRPSSATNTNDPLMTKTINMRVIVITNRDKLPHHHIRQPPNFLPPTLNHLPNLQAPRNPILTHTTHQEKTFTITADNSGKC